MIYAIWHIGQRILAAMHTVLTCWDFHKGGDENRQRLLRDPVMHDTLTMRLAFGRLFAPFSRYSADLQRLRAYRYERARGQVSQMRWDGRLGALLTRDEFEFLYGPDDPQTGASVTVPVVPVQPSASAAAAAV